MANRFFMAYGSLSVVAHHKKQSVMPLFFRFMHYSPYYEKFVKSILYTMNSLVFK